VILSRRGRRNYPGGFSLFRAALAAVDLVVEVPAAEAAVLAASAEAEVSEAVVLPEVGRILFLL
jgi:hypothetical protein